MADSALLIIVLIDSRSWSPSIDIIWVSALMRVMIRMTNVRGQNDHFAHFALIDNAFESQQDGEQMKLASCTSNI